MRHGSSNLRCRPIHLPYLGGALFLFVLLTACASPKHLKLPLDASRYQIETNDATHHVIRLNRQQDLASMLQDLGCDHVRCVVGDAGEISFVQIGKESIVTQANGKTTLGELMKRSGCGTRFVCSTDGKSVSILGARP